MVRPLSSAFQTLVVRSLILGFGVPPIGGRFRSTLGSGGFDKIAVRTGTVYPSETEGGYRKNRPQNRGEPGQNVPRGGTEGAGGTSAEESADPLPLIILNQYHEDKQQSADNENNEEDDS